MPAKPKIGVAAARELGRAGDVEEDVDAQVGLHRAGRPCTVPHGGVQATMTWSPTATWSTPVAHRDDLARALVAEDGRRRLGQRPVHGREVGVAHTGGVELDLDLARARVDDLDVVVDVDDFLADLVENRCAHPKLPPWCRPCLAWRRPCLRIRPCAAVSRNMPPGSLRACAAPTRRRRPTPRRPSGTRPVGAAGAGRPPPARRGPGPCRSSRSPSRPGTSTRRGR